MQSSLTRQTSLIAVLALGLVGLGPAAAFAEETETPSLYFTSEEVQQFRASFDELGIAPATQEALIAQLQAGEPLDSWSGSNSVSVTTSTAAGYRHTIESFADGSRSVTSVQLPRVVKGDRINATGTCTVPVGPYPYGWTFSGCNISRATGGLRMDYTINGRTRGNTSAYPARITGMSQTNCSFVGATALSTSKYIGAASGTTAWAQGTCQATLPWLGVFVYGLRVNVTYGIAAVEQ